MLAPRFLHFLKQELAWDCRTVSTCECGDQARDTGATGSMGYAKRALASESQSASPDEVAAVWRTMVSAYTRLYLSYEKDRLPAIAGVAQMFEKTRGLDSRYYEGIWSDSAVQDLAWEVWWGNKEKESHVRNEKVPSWSWASVSASIGYPTMPIGKFKSLCTLVDTGYIELLSTEPSESKKQEKIKKRTITILGHMVSATLQYRGQQAGMNLRPYTLQLTGHDKQRGFPEDESVELSGHGHVPHGGTVYYLILGKDHHDIYCSMIIKEMAYPQKRTYRRIGMARNGGNVFEGRLTEKASVCIC